MTAPIPGNLAGDGKKRPLWVVHQGNIVPSAEASLPLTTQGLHYGTGVFEGIRAHVSPNPDELLLFRAEDHYERFLRSCRLLQLKLAISARGLLQLTVDLLQRNGDSTDTYLRPVAYKLALLPGSRPGVALSGVSDSFSIISFPLGNYGGPAGIRCCVSTWVRPPQSVIPVQAKVTGGYVNNALASEEARASGYDDAIQLNTRGDVAEATTANIFVVRNGHLHTPPARADILEGITRDTVRALAATELDIQTREESLGRADLLLADEVFLTGTGIGVVPVTEISGRPIGAGVPGGVTQKLRRLYDDAVRGRLARYEHWLTRVRLPESLGREKA